MNDQERHDEFMRLYQLLYEKSGEIGIFFVLHLPVEDKHGPVVGGGAGPRGKRIPPSQYLQGYAAVAAHARLASDITMRALAESDGLGESDIEMLAKCCDMAFPSMVKAIEASRDEAKANGTAGQETIFESRRKKDGGDRG